MLSLYQALLSQHPQQLIPVRCAEQTIAQLHLYFEDVVLENKLAALVVESLPGKPERTPRGLARICEIARTARHAFFYTAPADALHTLPPPESAGRQTPILLSRTTPRSPNEHFILIADARFSALLVSSTNEAAAADADSFAERDVVWTFEPNIVYSALEYLMARGTAERSAHTAELAAAVQQCMPKATSLQLTLSVTTKLARLLQEQAAREVAVNRIASAIRSTLELPSILQTTVDEVGRSLGAAHCALRLTGEPAQAATMKCYARATAQEDVPEAELIRQLDASHERLAAHVRAHAADRRSTLVLTEEDELGAVAYVPIIYQQDYMGTLLVHAPNARRGWQKSERLLLRTVADQVALAISHARLQQQALTDGLTGCCNRRAFDMQLERDLQLAMRINQPVSLLMLDVDHFKRINDTYGHDAGDAALRYLAIMLRAELRAVDTAARVGGEEFAIILPQANCDGALLVAERLRTRLADTVMPHIGHLTASFGLASFPQHTGTSAQLIKLADSALYAAKHAGRNRICATAADLAVPVSPEK